MPIESLLNASCKTTKTTKRVPRLIILIEYMHFTRVHELQEALFFVVPRPQTAKTRGKKYQH
jgi:hypothetical protein